MCFKLEDVVLKIFTRHATAQKKGSFPLRIPSVNVTKSVGNWGFDHIYKGNP